MNEDPFVLRQKCFHPPYCPNEKCRFHEGKEDCGKEGKDKQKVFYWSNGWAQTACYPYRVRQFRCRFCKKNFRFTWFKLDYREKKPGLNHRIFSLLTCGVSNREIARRVGASEHLVRQRFKKLVQWSLIRQAELTQNLKINESIVYDGLEAFAETQYDPNHIQQAIGKESLFIYDFNFVPLNRKGRMSPRQKAIRSLKDESLGRYAPNAIRTGTREIFSRLYERRGDPSKALVIYSDEHFQYRKVVGSDLRNHQIQQICISSKQTRNYKNHLFSVNHADLLIRQHIGAFSRETICFAKKHVRMVGKYALFMVWKNFFRPQFVKTHKQNPKCNVLTPAMALGVAKKILEFHEFFDIRRTTRHVKLNREWQLYFHDRVPYPRTLHTTLC